MTELFVQRAGCPSVDALFLALYRGDKKESHLEPMAPLVFDAALAGDRAACGILASGGAYLGAMVNAVARKLDMGSDSFDVVMAGSVFKGSSTILADSMTDAIRLVCPSARPVMPAFEPVVGALLMGMELLGPVSDRAYATLAESLAQLERRHNVRLQAA
jgi:N-acetylglucosamine kinase-like BadF-type ATPase